MRGARRYAARHARELREKEAIVFNIDTVTHPEMFIMKGDVNGFVKNDVETVQTVAHAARVAGVPFRVRPFPFGAGGTDAFPFTVRGIRAVTLMPVDYPIRSMHFYHQASDDMDVLSIEPFENLLELAISWLNT